MRSRPLWRAILPAYAERIAAQADRELYKTFHNSLVRRFFLIDGVAPDLEFLALEIVPPAAAIDVALETIRKAWIPLDLPGIPDSAAVAAARQASGRLRLAVSGLKDKLVALDAVRDAMRRLEAHYEKPADIRRLDQRIYLQIFPATDTHCGILDMSAKCPRLQLRETDMYCAVFGISFEYDDENPERWPERLPKCRAGCHALQPRQARGSPLACLCLSSITSLAAAQW